MGLNMNAYGSTAGVLHIHRLWLFNEAFRHRKHNHTFEDTIMLPEVLEIASYSTFSKCASRKRFQPAQFRIGWHCDDSIPKLYSYHLSSAT